MPRTRPQVAKRGSSASPRANSKEGPQTLSITFFTRGEKIESRHQDLYKVLEENAAGTEERVKPFGTAVVFTALEHGLASPLANIELISQEVGFAMSEADESVEVLMEREDCDKAQIEDYQSLMRDYADTLADDYTVAITELQRIVAEISPTI